MELACLFTSPNRTKGQRSTRGIRGGFRGGKVRDEWRREPTRPLTEPWPGYRRQRTAASPAASALWPADLNRGEPKGIDYNEVAGVCAGRWPPTELLTRLGDIRLAEKPPGRKRELSVNIITSTSITSQQMTRSAADSYMLTVSLG